MEEPQCNLEERVNPSILKDNFSSRTDLSIFTAIAPVLLDQSNETSCIFPALKSTSHFQPQATFSPQCLVDQIQVQKAILVVATDQMPDHTKLLKIDISIQV